MAVFELLVLGAATVLLVYLLNVKRSKLKGIPEPPGNFLLGHALKLRGPIPPTLLKWRKEVGPVFQVRVLNTRFLVLNDKDSITNICSRPEAAGRWRFGILGRLAELFGEGAGFSEGPSSQEQRNFYLKAFRIVGIGRAKSEEAILEEVDQMVQKWTEMDGKPFEMDGFATHYAANAIWNLLGSKRFSAEQAEAMEHCIHSIVLIENMQQRLNILFTKTMEKVSRSARELTNQWRRVMMKSCSDLVESHFEGRIRNEPRDVIDMLLDRMDVTENPASPFHRDNLKNAFMIHEILMASLHSTAKILEWIFAYLARHPDAQARLHEEIDDVVGITKDPVQLYYRDRMPFVQACINETLRMSSLVPLSMAHAAMEDFQFQGSTIPKGTIIIPNLYAAHYDPETWDRPDEFDPDRFLTPEGQLDTNMTKNVLAFGIGRRSCIGYNISMDMLFLFVANVYKRFEVQIPNCPDKIEGRIGVDISPPAGLKVKLMPRKLKDL